MKQEFEQLIDSVISEQDFEICNMAYGHPMFSETKGKQQIARLYKAGGMVLMKTLAPIGAAYIDYYNKSLNMAAEEEATIKEITEKYAGFQTGMRDHFINQFGDIIDVKLKD